MNRTVRNLKAMAEQDELSRPTGRVDLYGVLADMRGKPMARSLMSPEEARRVANELLIAATAAEGRLLSDAERMARRAARLRFRTDAK